MMTFDLCIPTFNRKEKLLRCVNSIPKQKNIKIWLYFDNNDKTANDFYSNDYIEKVIMPKKYQAFGIWNYHLQKFNKDIFIYLCDDTDLYPNTLNMVEKHFKEKFPDTDGVVTFKQANMKGTDSAMGCIGRKFIERYPDNQVFCPNFVSFYADTELGDYAKKLNKFYYGEDCLINHYHPITGISMDSTHHIIRGKDKTIDIQINALRREQNLLWGESLKLIDRNSL